MPSMVLPGLPGPASRSGNGVAVNNQWFSKVAVWLVIALVLFTVFKQFERTGVPSGAIGYSDFLEEVRGKRIKSVQLQDLGGGTTSSTTASNSTSSRARNPLSFSLSWHPGARSCC
jgi:hypothetical protein